MDGFKLSTACYEKELAALAPVTVWTETTSLRFTESLWTRAKRDTDNFANNSAIAFGLLSGVVLVAATGLIGRFPLPHWAHHGIQRYAVHLVALVLIYVFAIYAIAGLCWCRAFFLQRTEGRTELVDLRERFAADTAKEKARTDEMEASQRKAWDDVNADRNRILGLLDDAESRINDLDALVMELEALRPPPVVEVEASFLPRRIDDQDVLLTMKLASGQVIPRGTQLNLITPQAWGELVEANGLGRPSAVSVGEPMFSDEDLMFWGRPLPALLWTHAIQDDIRARVAAVWHFRVSTAKSHPYPIKLNIDGVTVFAGLVEVPKTSSEQMTQLIRDAAEKAKRESNPFYFTFAEWGVGDETFDPIDRLNARIHDGKINFIANNATLGQDPAPDKRKTLLVRWVRRAVRTRAERVQKVLGIVDGLVDRYDAELADLELKPADLDRVVKLGELLEGEATDRVSFAELQEALGAVMAIAVEFVPAARRAEFLGRVRDRLGSAASPVPEEQP